MLKRVFIFLNVLALLVLLLSCLAAYIDPKLFWQFSFIGFAFPVVLVINFLFLAVWLLKRSKLGFLPLLAILLSWKFIHATFAFNFLDKSKETGIRLMTWNVKSFDLYNWTHNIETRRKMMDLIKKENPDVLCLQEFYSNNQVFHNVEFLRDTLGYKYCYFPPAVELVKTPRSKLQKTLWRSGTLDQQWGVATFSKFPITDTGRVDFGNSLANSCIYTDVNMEGKNVRLYNVHFQSIHLGYDDYAAIDSLEENQQTNWGAMKNIMRKMKKAYIKRSQQANSVAAQIDAYKGTQILCGDFNDVPVSYTYNAVSKSLDDAFIERGFGFGATFANKFSIFRIDYALFDPDIQINTYRIIRKELSDHYPVLVSFSL
ncbi:MAG: hypothetical protein JWO06_1047 [Bacteroidota bacterium]|nr:hypothetical protein [Bacteroidota bacterium]